MSRTCYEAPACRVALDELTDIYPNRRRSSDGICASAQHHQQNPGSDHEPHIIINDRGYASAFDISDDPGVCDAHDLVERLRIARDPRIKYVISNRRMFSSYSGTNITAWEWRKYSGPNPHDTHVHVSVLREWIFNTDPWFRPLLEDQMTDGTRNRLIREWYITYIGREPKTEEQTWWRGYWFTQGDAGEDLVLAGIYDSKEAQDYRKKQMGK